jgi:two-component system chemotaxis response regulator CheB
MQTRIAKEIEIAAEDDAFHKGIMELGALTPFTCPECHGVLVKIDEGNMARSAATRGTPLPIVRCSKA